MSSPRALLAVPLVLLLLLGTALVAGAAGAPRTPAIEVQLYEFGIEPAGITLTPGSNASFHLVNTGLTPHNLYIGDGGDVAKWDPLIDPGKDAWLNFTVPASGIVPYYCNVIGHRELGMEGNLTAKGSAPVAHAGGEKLGAEEVRILGVEYFAYWIGVISFIVLFLVIAATFFLLRYGETNHWTDWRDRPSRAAKDGPPPKMTGSFVVLGIVFLLFLIAAWQVLRVV